MKFLPWICCGIGMIPLVILGHGVSMDLAITGVWCSVWFRAWSEGLMHEARNGS